MSTTLITTVSIIDARTLGLAIIEKISKTASAILRSDVPDTRGLCFVKTRNIALGGR
jgi:hypothetical protein